MVLEMRAEVVEGVGGCFHASVLDVLHGAHHLLVHLRRCPSLALGPGPNALALHGFGRRSNCWLVDLGRLSRRGLVFGEVGKVRCIGGRDISGL